MRNSAKAVNLGSEKVTSDEELVRVYQRRIGEFGYNGRTLFYASEEQHALKLAQYASILHELVSYNDTLLDIGCGYGSLVPFLPQCVYEGIDLVPEFIQHASARHDRMKFTLTALDDLQGTYDWSLLLGVLNGVPDPHRLLYSAWNKCRKGLVVDFIDRNKFQGLASFDIGKCLNILLRKGAGQVSVYPSTSVWTIFVAKKQGKWLSSRSTS